MRTRALTVVLLATCLKACASSASFVALAPHHAMANVERRDTVRVRTTDGRHIEFEVVRLVQPDVIQGAEDSVRIADIDLLEVRKSRSGGGSNLLSLGRLFKL